VAPESHHDDEHEHEDEHDGAANPKPQLTANGPPSDGPYPGIGNRFSQHLATQIFLTNGRRFYAKHKRQNDSSLQQS
jgi:hypothetical protein